MPFQRQIRFIFWFLKETFSRYLRLIIFALIFILLLVFISTKFAPKFSGSRVKLITTGVIGLYKEDNFPVEIQSLISSGLTNLTESGEATSSLASWWEVQDSGKTYIFHLKEGIEWQDGKAFNGKDIIGNLYNVYNLTDIQTDMPNFFTIKFKLKEPYSPFPTVLSKPILKKNLIGTGEYRVTELMPLEDGEHIARLVLSPKDPKQPLMIYKFYPTEKSAVTAFKLGEIDHLSGISDSSIFSNWSNVKIDSKVNYQKVAAVYFNTKDSVLSNRAVRQALAYAIPDSVFAGQERATGPISRASWAYFDGVKRYKYDLDQAKKILQKSSTEGLMDNGTDKEKVASGPGEIKVTLTTTPSLEKAANEIKQAWDQMGVATTVSVEPKPSGNFQALLAIMLLPADPDQYALWHSTQKTNITGFAKPRIDQALEEGRKTVDKEVRMKHYTEFQKIIVDEVPAVFLYYPKESSISRI